MKSKPQTAILHYTSPPVIGGVEAVIYHQVESFINNSFPVTVIAGRGNGNQLSQEADFIAIPLLDSRHPEILEMNKSLENGRVPENFTEIKDKIHDQLAPILQDFDHIIVHNILTKHYNLPLTAAIHTMLKNETIAHCIAWCHDFTWTSPHSSHKVKPGFPWDLLRIRHPKITYVTVSVQRQMELAQLFQCEREQIKVIYNGVNPEQLLAFSDEGFNLIQRLDLLNSDLNILMPVRVTQAKNIEFAIRVVGQLKEKFNLIRLIITGPPDPHDALIRNYYEELRELVNKLNLHEEVRFVYAEGPNDAPFKINYEMIGELYRVSDLLFMPSHREGFGMPVLEAGLVGLSVFTTKIPASVEIGGTDVVLFDTTQGSNIIADKIFSWSQQNRTYHFKKTIRKEYTWNALFQNQLLPLITMEP
jgi:glycosyltransferase involved in cell wall biosynthesis